jgi:drug/metabolite transporter (DMT)-like permease
MTSILYITKFLYELNPDIEVLQVTSMKALISVGILVLALNVKLKYVMYDRVDPDSKWALAFKSCQTTSSIFISYTAMKYFSVSTAGVVCSLTPLVACILAALILKERLTFWTIFSVVIVLSCVMMILFGATGEEAEAMDENMMAVIGLIAQPFLLAGGMVAARKMKKNHPLAVTCYSNLLLGTVSFIGVQCYDHINYEFVSTLSGWSWVLITLAGLFTIFENTAKFMAFRYEQASKL